MRNIIIATALSLCVAAPAFAAKSGNYYDAYDARDHSNMSDRMAHGSKMYIGLSGGQQSTNIPNLSAEKNPNPALRNQHNTFCRR